jgi:hypothetical protein
VKILLCFCEVQETSFAACLQYKYISTKTTDGETAGASGFKRGFVSVLSCTLSI